MPFIIHLKTQLPPIIPKTQVFKEKKLFFVDPSFENLQHSIPTKKKEGGREKNAPGHLCNTLHLNQKLESSY